MPARRTVNLVTLGCARNDVDSEEIAARLEDEGWSLVDDAADASVVVVNTCGFIEAAKRESIDTLLVAADSGRPVVATGCLAERYGTTLAEALPEAAAVLGFDDYERMGSRLDDVVAGREVTSHRPRDRRKLLPIAPADRGPHAPGRHGEDLADLPEGIAPASGPRPLRRRLGGGPVAPIKLASGCDRRCTFCAIPAFRGAFVSRRPEEILEEARWLADHGVRELVCVSENSTSYGKDLRDLRLLEKLLPRLAAVPGIVRVRVSYLQPAEMRPDLIDVMANTEGIAPYFDLSFQHASPSVLRRMRRFGDRVRFLTLLDQIRELDPAAGVRSNFIVGFPGETRSDVAELERFLSAARLDAIGVFGYSDEDGTEAAGFDRKVRSDTAARRLDRITRLADELVAQRAEERIGSVVEVLVEEERGEGRYEGRAAHQAPETDGGTTVLGSGLGVGDLVRVKVTAADGVDLIGTAIDAVSPA